MVWHATSECTPDMSPHDCKFTLKVPEPPEEKCTHNSTTNGCSNQGHHTAWFTNFTSVPEVTLQARIDKESVIFIDESLRNIYKRKTKKNAKPKA